MKKIRLMALLLLANLAVLSWANAQSEKNKTIPAQTEVKKNNIADAHSTNTKKRVPPAPKNESNVISSDQTKQVRKEDETKRTGELHSEPMTSPK